MITKRTDSYIRYLFFMYWSPFYIQPNLVVESDVNPSLHSNCHHQIIFVKFNLKIHYPPPCYCHVWHYQEVETELVRLVIDLFDWKKAFENTSVHEKVAIFNKTILNIPQSIFPHETLLVDYKDSLWITNKTKKVSLIKITQSLSIFVEIVIIYRY